MEKALNGKLSNVMDTAGALVPGDTLVVQKNEDGSFEVALTKKTSAMSAMDGEVLSPPLFTPKKKPKILNPDNDNEDEKQDEHETQLNWTATAVEWCIV